MTIDLRSDTVTRPTEAMLEAMRHAEMGGVASVASLFFKGLPGTRGAIDIDELEEALSPALHHNRLATALICMETTHNDAGGAVLPLEHMARVAAVARANGIPVHTDGARVFNAAVKLGVPARRIAEHTDSITF